MTAPGDKDVEVHLFGPGYGESVLVHLGFGEWLIVDSCMARGSTVPAPIAYLESVGVDPATAVKVIVASHWHDDHVRGLSSALKRCVGASFWCPRALFDREFVMLTMDASSRPMSRAGSGVDEFRVIIDELRARAKFTGKKLAGIGLNFAQANSTIRQRTDPADHSAAIHSLSPSDAETLLALQTIGRLVENVRAGEQTKRARGRVPSPRPNNTAVALHVRIRDVHLLLGADLEEVGADLAKGKPPFEDCGWTAIVGSSTRPTEKSTLFKVAHHGSSTAHCEAVWTDMLASNPLAIMTPFRNGSVRLPTDGDVNRLGRLTDHLFTTARSATKRAKPTNPVVAREFALAAKEVWEAAAMGHIRASIPDTADRRWTVDTFRGATQL